MLQGKVIRIAFNIIQETSGQQHCEVTGRMPGLNSALEAALSDGADLAQLMAEATSDLQVLADFCKELATST